MAGTVAVLVALLGSMPVALAQDPATTTTAAPLPADHGEGVRALSLGSGLRATAASTDAIASNPAGLPFGRLYHLEGSAGYEPNADRWSLGAAVVDSATSALAAGLSVRGILGNGQKTYNGIDGRLGLGFPVSEAVAIGLGGRYLSLSQAGRDAAGDETSEDVATGFTMDAALRLHLADILVISALAYNLIDIDSSVAPRTLGGGVGIVLDGGIAFGADALVDIATYDHAAPTFGGGFEYLANGQIPLRIGYRLDVERELHAISAGVGYVDQAIGVEIAVAQEVSGGDGTEVMGALRYFVH